MSRPNRHFATEPRLRTLAFGLALGLAACATGRVESDGGADDAAVGDAASTDGGIGSDAAFCVGDPCDLFAQCGCPPAQVCDLDTNSLASAGTRCRDVLIPGDETSTCDKSNECAAGYACLGGQCRLYCDGDDACGAGQHCIVEIGDGNGGTVPGVRACSKACSPELAAANGCPESPQFGCHLFIENPDGVGGSGDEFYVTDCVPPPSSGGGDGTDCSTLGHAACRPGFDCVSVGGGQKLCQQSCIYDPPGSSACAAGTCTQFQEPRPIVDGVEYGFCQQ